MEHHKLYSIPFNTPHHNPFAYDQSNPTVVHFYTISEWKTLLPHGLALYILSKIIDCVRGHTPLALFLFLDKKLYTDWISKPSLPLSDELLLIMIHCSFNLFAGFFLSIVTCNIGPQFYFNVFECFGIIVTLGSPVCKKGISFTW